MSDPTFGHKSIQGVVILQLVADRMLHTEALRKPGAAKKQDCGKVGERLLAAEWESNCSCERNMLADGHKGWKVADKQHMGPTIMKSQTDVLG
jgi:hypothetical protein